MLKYTSDRKVKAIYLKKRKSFKDMSHENATHMYNKHAEGLPLVSKDLNLKLLSCGKLYHVYFIYDKSGSDWVEDTVHNLETSGYVCCYRERDFVPGKTKTSNIIYSLENAIKFVAVISMGFFNSPHCQYELDLALDECLNRSGEISDLIPVIIDNCEIPKKLKIITPLDIQIHKDTWWEKLLRSLNEEKPSSALSTSTESNTSLDRLAEDFRQKLQCTNLQELMSFLCKPVAMELSHFLSQHGDLRMFISAMETCGITFDGNVVKVHLSIFKEHLIKAHYVSQCFSEHVRKLDREVSRISLFLKSETDVVDRQNNSVMTQFTRFVKAVLKTPEHTFWGIMWKMQGLQMKRNLRDECRGMIHDAVNEQVITAVAHPHMCSLQSRLETYKDWPCDKLPKPLHLAEAGYFLDGPNDVLRCFHCNGVTWDLKPYEDPWKRHAKWLFYCPYIKKHKGEEFIKQARFAKKDEREVYNPLFSSLDTRASSYQGWTDEMGPTARSMAKAGFYFTKFEDKVVCFACGYGVRHWKSTDDPWYRHAWWSPHCRYVRRNKGQSFIDCVQGDRAKTEPSDYCVLTYSIMVRDTK